MVEPVRSFLRKYMKKKPYFKQNLKLKKKKTFHIVREIKNNDRCFSSCSGEKR